MSKQSISTALGLVAGTVFFIGIIASTSSLLRYPNTKRQQIKDINYIKLLDDLEQRFDKLNIQTAPLNDLDYSNLPNPEDLIKSIFGSDKIEYLEQNKKDCGSNYTINQLEISLKDVSLEKLPALIRTMESLRPPIRLSSCTITASTTTSGIGNVTLRLNRIERP